MLQLMICHCLCPFSVQVTHMVRFKSQIKTFIIYEEYSVYVYTWRIHTMMVPADELAI